MAIKPEIEYTNATPADAAYPYGSAKNSATSTSRDGTPLEKAWLNDIWGFLQALLTEAAVVPTGEPDTAIASQYLTALQTLTASAAQGLLADTALQPGDAASAAQGLLADTALQPGDFNSSIATNGYRQYPDGGIEQWGVLSGVALDQTFHVVTFPLAFPTACFNIQATLAMPSTVVNNIAALVKKDAVTLTQFQVAGDGDNASDTGDIYWRAIGH